MPQQIHDFVKKYTRILKWIPRLNILVFLYWMFRMVFIRREMEPFGVVAGAMGISVVAVIAGAALSQFVLSPLLGMAQDQLLDYVMPVIITFVVIPAFITAFAKHEGA